MTVMTRSNRRNRVFAYPLAARISGFEGITPGRNVEFTPTWTTLRTDTLAASPGNSMLSGDPDTDIGLSGRWGVTTNLSLNAALNPDFSQVEADPQDLFSQLLFSCKSNPQTVLFIGYSDNHDNDDGSGLTMKDRTFFFKLGYAWVL